MKTSVFLQKADPAPKDDGKKRSEWIASAVVDTTSGTAYQYVTLEQSVVLEPTTEYFLASYEDNDEAEVNESFINRISATRNTTVPVSTITFLGNWHYRTAGIGTLNEWVHEDNDASGRVNLIVK